MRERRGAVRRHGKRITKDSRTTTTKEEEEGRKEERRKKKEPAIHRGGLCLVDGTPLVDGLP